MPADNALHKAAHNGSKDECAELVGKPDADGKVPDGKFSVNEKGANGRTPLHRAIGGNHIECATFLLEQEGDINAADKSGRTPLHWAAIAGHVEAVRLCLNNGALTNSATKTGMTPLHAAAEGNHMSCVQQLIATLHPPEKWEELLIPKFNVETQLKLDLSCKIDGKTAKDLAGAAKHKEIKQVLVHAEKGNLDKASKACSIM